MWARACSIWAATHHWLNLTEGERCEGVSLLKGWAQSVDFSSVLESDLDLAAALGGLCALGQADWASEFVRSPTFVRACPESNLSYLAVIVGLLDAGLIEKAVDLVRDAGSRIPESDAKAIAYKYATEKGINMPRIVGQCTVGLPAAMTIAAAAHSDCLTRLVRTHDKESFSFISPDLGAVLEFDAADPTSRSGRRGRQLFFGIIGSVLTATLASIGLGLWQNPGRFDWTNWVYVPATFLMGVVFLWRGKAGFLGCVMGGCIGVGGAMAGAAVSVNAAHTAAHGLLAATYLGTGVVLWRSSSLRGFVSHRREIATLAQSGSARSGDLLPKNGSVDNETNLGTAGY
jgi:hypothetical protein